jgi:hypothetical protein
VVLARVWDRMALEQENRELLRQTSSGGSHPASSAAGLAWRLDAIEERLASIEAMLRAMKSETA